MNIVFLDPSFSNTDLKKDYGQIPLHLSKLGYNVKILAYTNKGNRDIKNFDSVKLVKLHGFGLLNIPLLYYILKKRTPIDCVFAYLSVSAAFTSMLFRITRKDGIFIIKMDSEGRLYRGNFLVKREDLAKRRCEGLFDWNEIIKELDAHIKKPMLEVR